MVVIKVKDFGEIKVQLDYQNAPLTANNFVKLIKEKFYDNLTFHRIIKGFMIQGGDPLGNGTGGAKEKIVGEFKANGYQNNLSHQRGVISMARAASYNSASSQFFIMHQDGTYLDGNYASFGRVVEGIEIVDRIANVKTDRNDKPLQKVIIESITLIDEK